MQYTTLGHSGLVVSRLAFGAMTFGVGELVPGVTNNIDQAGADQIVGRALDDLVQQGKVRYIGFSNYPAWKAARMLGIQERNGYIRFVAAQMYYSLLGCDLEHEVTPFVEDTGLGVLVWSPLASGFLSGKYTRENPAPKGARRNKFQLPPIDVEKGYDVVDLIRQIAQNHSSSPAQVALAWILTKPFISSIIIGANKISHLEDNLSAVHLNLSRQEVEQLDELTAPQPIYLGWMQPLGWDAKVKEVLDPQSMARVAEE